MILVLTNALVPAGVAAELARRLPTLAPTLAHWLGAAAPTIQSVPVAEVGCTADQAWQLQRAGYRPPPPAPLGAGWPLLEPAFVNTDPDAPVWLAELTHLRVAQRGVTLLDPASVALSPTHAAALLETATPLLADLDIGLAPLPDGRIRVQLPPGVAPYAPTPAAVAGTDIQDLWSQDATSRPWRRALNLVQMAWHDHPANAERDAAGLPPINGLWLYGGGRRSDLSPPAASADSVVVDDTLATAGQAGDWAAWLDALARLETTRLAALAHAGPPTTLVLTGDERIVTLDLTPPRGLRRWLPTRRQDWSTWWRHPA